MEADMGRSRKPVDMQKGHVLKREKEQKQQEEEYVTVGKDQLKRAPVWLIDNVAKKEWSRLIKELDKIDIIGNLDKNNLGAYCNAFSKYLQVSEELAGSTLTVRKETKYGVQIVPNPLIGIQKMYAEEMRKFAALCGLTIDSRLKAAVTKTSKKEDEISDKFGDI